MFNMEKMPVKILIVYHVFSYYRLQVMRTLSQDRNLQVTILAGRYFEAGLKTIEIKDAYQELFRLKFVKNIWLFKGNLLWQSGLISECLSGKYDAIIFLGNPYFLSTWVAAILSRWANKKVFFWAHATIRNKLRDKIKLYFYKLAHGLLLYSNGAKNNLIKYGFNHEDIFVVYNSLDYETQEKLKEKLDVEKLVLKRKEFFVYSKNPVLIFIGRLTPEKKLDYLVSVCVQLLQRGMPVNVLFIGGGEEETNLRQLVVKNGIQDHVVFYGECYDEEKLATLIAMSDLCVSPGNVGLTAIHALNYGTPVITHNNPYMQGPEYEAIEPGVTGMLYEYESLDSLVNIVHVWLAINHDKREEIRKKCYEVVGKHYTTSFQASAISFAIYHILGLNNQNSKGKEFSQ